MPAGGQSGGRSGGGGCSKKILLLHGNRQTGELLLGRLGKFKKALWQDANLDVVAPDAPHLFSDGDMDQDDDGQGDASDGWQRTWWHRKGNAYDGLKESLQLLDLTWNEDGDREFVGLMGFSQGSRLAHLATLLHTATNGEVFPGLQFVVHFSGYGDVPMPENFRASLSYRWAANVSPSCNFDDVQINVPSLHVMGEIDRLIPLASSEALLKCYAQPMVYRHPGSHFVPVKRANVEKYLMFITSILQTQHPVAAGDSNKSANAATAPPDEEHAQAQIDEVAAIAQIYPSEFRLLSNSTPKDPDAYDPDDYFEENRSYEHPITYSIILQPKDGLGEVDESLWPPKDIALCIQYTAEYPNCSPSLSFLHDMNYFEFSSQASEALLDVCRRAMEEESGMPCVMGIVYAAREFFESGGLASNANISGSATQRAAASEVEEEGIDGAEEHSTSTSTLLRPSSAAAIKECNAQGLQIASELLGRSQPNEDGREVTVDQPVGGKGGRWHYTVGLVGKPSAGKSTFFNAATSFARQRGEEGGEARSDEDGCEDQVFLGGASMAPHPFTTIDPNVGYCLIPAPEGSCPEDDAESRETSGLVIGSSHGRDSKGRRMLPVTLKDVAGLVPGAYQGRGRGNKFLDDLTDADVLIHIVDASGSSDAEGNKCSDGSNGDDLNHPLNDLEWVRNELVEWVYTNLQAKWESVMRRGREKLVGMFSGYKQSQSFTQDVLAVVEKYVRDKEGRDIFASFDTWDEADLHRLVSAFLGARFPMALALNKSDIPSAAQHIEDIKAQLPIHGAHVAVALSAHAEMNFIRQQLLLAMRSSRSNSSPSQSESTNGRVWDCLQQAMSLREPTLVFPVNDMLSYEPLPGMENYATRDSSLPNHGFISALTAAGGSAPSQWDAEKRQYIPSTKGDAKPVLRDVLMMRPRSTVEDVFNALKNIGVLEGEFVRAEAASRIGEKSRSVTKSDPLGVHNRILRIMTTKRREWQKKISLHTS